jgi:hypothetical protein
VQREQHEAWEAIRYRFGILVREESKFDELENFICSGGVYTWMRDWIVSMVSVRGLTVFPLGMMYDS